MKLFSFHFFFSLLIFFNFLYVFSGDIEFFKKGKKPAKHVEMEEDVPSKVSQKQPEQLQQQQPPPPRSTSHPQLLQQARRSSSQFFAQRQQQDNGIQQQQEQQQEQQHRPPSRMLQITGPALQIVVDVPLPSAVEDISVSDNEAV